jgi:hypothetical protein
MLLATMAQVGPVAPRRRSLSLVRWLVPALVGATAVLVWVDVARRNPVVPTLPSSPVVSDKQAPAREPVPAEKPKDAPPAAASPPISPPKVMERKAASQAAPPPPAPATPVRERDRGATLKEEANRVLQRDALMSAPAPFVTVTSVDGSLWRISGDGTVGHSSDGGATWREQSPGSRAVRFVAGSSPSPNVVWFVGAGGTVLLTADGVSWQSRSLPERVDLTGITAVDARTATVTTADGRRFTTHDAGLTWLAAPLQENPPAPF